MKTCNICQKEFNNINGLAKHISSAHKEVSKEQYYNNYINETNTTCKCGSKKKFRHLGVGYLEYCSCKCKSKYVETTKYWTGKKQPQELINKRRNTMIERHGVPCGYLLGHSSAEQYKGFVCRSKYEKSFVDFAEKYKYTLFVPEKIEYDFDGRNRWYYPDFYIQELNILVEIKSVWTWNQNLQMNLAKKQFTLSAGHDIIIINENHHLLDCENWDKLNEYILSSCVSTKIG